MNFLAKLFASIGLLTAETSTVASPLFWYYEPETPKSLIK